jgi:sensor histidine kinase YesM
MFILFQVISLFRFKGYNYNFYYLLYLAFTYTYFLTEFGIIKLNFIETFPDMEETLTFVIICCSCLFLLLFIYDFNKDVISPRFKLLIQVILSIFVIILLITTFQIFKLPVVYPIVFYSILSLVVLSFLTALSLSIAGALKNIPRGKYLSFSFTFLVFGAVLKPLSISGIIDPTFFSSFGAIIGHLLEIIIVSSILINLGINQIKNTEQLKHDNLILEKTALSSQINPHFIFNCLNAIQHFVVNNDKSAASKYLIKFARLIRTTLNASNQQSISIGQEIEFLNSYMTLEQLRHDHKFSFDITKSDNLNPNTLISPMLIQPFIENAIIHGLKKVQSNGEIKVSFSQTGSHVEVKVSDNGSGISTKIENSDHKSMGSSLTRKRLQLINNKENNVIYKTFTLENDNKTGTEVTILINPIQKL